MDSDDQKTHQSLTMDSSKHDEHRYAGGLQVDPPASDLPIGWWVCKEAPGSGLNISAVPSSNFIAGALFTYGRDGRRIVLTFSGNPENPIPLFDTSTNKENGFPGETTLTQGSLLITEVGALSILTQTSSLIRVLIKVTPTILATRVLATVKWVKFEGDFTRLL